MRVYSILGAALPLHSLADLILEVVHIRPNLGSEPGLDNLCIFRFWFVELTLPVLTLVLLSAAEVLAMAAPQ